MTFAKGGKAWGECARSGRKMLLKDMVEDGYVQGLIVDPAWRDGYHPQEYLPEVKDPIAVQNPAPDNNVMLTEIRFPNYDVDTGQTNNPLILQWYLEYPQVSIEDTFSEWNDDADEQLITDDGFEILFNA